jgi:hypothetical protein
VLGNQYFGDRLRGNLLNLHLARDLADVQVHFGDINFILCRSSDLKAFAQANASMQQRYNCHFVSNT